MSRILPNDPTPEKDLGFGQADAADALGPQSQGSPALDLSRDGFRQLAQRKLLTEADDIVFKPETGRPPGPSDFDLNPDMFDEIDRSQVPRAAAVLIPVVADETLSVILTERSKALPRHPGQIAFPGGKIEPSDASPLGAALRETHEEIGLSPSFVEPLGFLDGYLTRTGFHVIPIVGLVRPGFSLKLDEREVARAFQVPLSFLMDQANHLIHKRDFGGAERAFYAMPYGDAYIWGATAGMIKTLHRRLTT